MLAAVRVGVTVIFVSLCVAVASAHAQPAAPAQPASRASADRIPSDALVQMYRRELGPLFDRVGADQLLAAHALLEDYFTAASSADRKAVVAKLEATGIDANILGRL